MIIVTWLSIHGLDQGPYIHVGVTACYGCNTNLKYSPDGILPTASSRRPVKIYHSIDTPTSFPLILKVHVTPNSSQ